MTALTDDALWDAITGLHAYDLGAVDSGIHDDALRAAVRSQLMAMPSQVRMRFLSQRYRDVYWTNEGLAKGYGLEDAAEFYDWLIVEMDCIDYHRIPHAG